MSKGCFDLHPVTEPVTLAKTVTLCLADPTCPHSLQLADVLALLV